MKLRELIIQNFRNLTDVRVPISDTTVLVGENNSGKTAMLEALQLALPRTGFGRTNPFDEYDYHMCSPEDSPQTSMGIVIELWFREDTPDEWPEAILQSLNEIVQTDPITDIDSVGLRLTSKYQQESETYAFSREFLNLAGEPLTGTSQSPASVTRFLQYIRLFYLSALRDSAVEFSPKSQFWGRILRDLRIDEDTQRQLSEQLTALNASLLDADPRLAQVRQSLEQIQNVVAAGGNASVQPLPLRPWDLMAKSQVVIQSQGSEVEFPLSKHGQGIQSLAVLFVFQAFVDVLLKPTFEPETEALLALEEPEAHLHPHAIRALTRTIGQVGAQKVISTHSPYVLQHVPIQDLRLFRRSGATARVLHLRRSFSATVPFLPALSDYCEVSNGKYEYHEGNQTLTVHGIVDEDAFRALVQMYPNDVPSQQQIRQLRTASQLYISDEEIEKLNTYATRIRGEVFFARAWLLCEGQSDFMLFHFFAEVLGVSLDRAGVSVIDFKNNGSPSAFVALARTFEIPWIMVCDDDNAGKQYVREVTGKGLSNEEQSDQVRQLPEVDLEMYLVKSGFLTEYHHILTSAGVSLTKTLDEAGVEEEVAGWLRKGKTDYASALIQRLRDGGAGEDCVPELIESAIRDIIAKAE